MLHELRKQRFVWIAVLVVMLTAVPVGGVVLAGCEGDGNVTCNGDKGGEQEAKGDDKDNDIKVEEGGSANDSKDRDDDAVSGEGGNDNIDNDGKVNGDINGGDGNDTITNDGSVNGDIEGGEGADSIENNGEARELIGDESDDAVKPVDTKPSSYGPADHGPSEPVDFDNDTIDNNGTATGITGDGDVVIEADDAPIYTICNNDQNCQNVELRPDVAFGDDEITNDGEVTGRGRGGVIQGDGDVTVVSGNNNPYQDACQFMCINFPNFVDVIFGNDEITNNEDARTIIGDGDVSINSKEDTIVLAEQGDDIIINNGSVGVIYGDGMQSEQEQFNQTSFVKVPIGCKENDCSFQQPGFQNVNVQGGDDTIVNNGSVGMIDAGGGDDEITISAEADGKTFIDGGSNGEKGDTLIFEVDNDSDREQVDQQQGQRSGNVIFKDGRQFKWADIENLLAILIGGPAGGNNNDDADDEEEVVLLEPVALFNDLKSMVAYMGGDGLAIFRYTEDLEGIGIGFVSYEAIANASAGDTLLDDTAEDGYRILVTMPENSSLQFQLFDPSGAEIGNVTETINR